MRPVGAGLVALSGVAWAGKGSVGVFVRAAGGVGQIATVKIGESDCPACSVGMVDLALDLEILTPFHGFSFSACVYRCILVFVGEMDVVWAVC